MKAKTLLVKTLIFFASLLVTGLVAAETEIPDDQYIIFYHNDALGSPVAVTDHNGNTLWHEQNDPFGQVRDRVMPTGKEFFNDLTGSRKGYTGHLKDSGSDLTYMKARFYDPDIGRFYSNDPVGFTTSSPMMFNRYAYANNNPFAHTDPDGKAPEPFAVKDLAVAAGKAFAGLGAWTVGHLTDDEDLIDAAVEGMEENSEEGLLAVVGFLDPTGLSSKAKKFFGIVPNNAPKYARNKYKSVPRTEKKRVLDENPTCVYCESKPSTQVDHIRSQKQDWVEGGFNDSRDVRSARVNDPANLTGSCQSCNASKGSKPLGTGSDQWTPPKDR